MPTPDPEKKRKISKAHRPDVKIQVPRISRADLSQLLLALNSSGQRLDRRRVATFTATDAGPVAFRRRFKFFAQDVLEAQTAILSAVAALLQVQINIKEQFNEE